MAAPRVALFASGASPAELRVARVTLESAQLDVSAIDMAALSYAGEVQVLGEAREAVAKAAGAARALFLSVRFAEVRELAAEAERLAGIWRGVPVVARGLAELALLSGQGGDPNGFVKAAAFHPVATLEHASWSPEVRAAYAKALAATYRTRRVTLSVAAPADAAVFVDGIARGSGVVEVSVPLGEHAIYVTQDGRLPFGANVKVDRPMRVLAEMRTAAADALPGLARMRLVDGEVPTSAEVEAAIRVLDVDALAILHLSSTIELALTGSGIPTERFVGRGDSLAAVESAAKQAGTHFREVCGLSHAPPDRGRAATDLTLRIGISACALRINARYRVSHGDWRSSGAAAGGASTVGVVIPAAALPSADRPYLLEYTIDAVGRGDRVIASLGHPSAPLRLAIDPDRRPPHWYRKWWVWTLVGAAAAAAIITPAVLLSRPDPDARLIGSP